MDTQEPIKRKNRRSRTVRADLPQTPSRPAPEIAAGPSQPEPGARSRRSLLNPDEIGADSLEIEITTQRALMRRVAELAGIGDLPAEDLDLDDLLETLREYSLGGARLAGMLKAQKELQDGSGGALTGLNKMLAEIVKELEQ